MNKWMRVCNAETVMKVVNALFFLSTFIVRRGIGFLAYLLWGAYLLWCVRRSPAGVFRWVYIFLLAFVAVMLAGSVLAFLGAI